MYTNIGFSIGVWHYFSCILIALFDSYGFYQSISRSKMYDLIGYIRSTIRDIVFVTFSTLYLLFSVVDLVNKYIGTHINSGGIHTTTFINSYFSSLFIYFIQVDIAYYLYDIFWILTFNPNSIYLIHHLMCVVSYFASIYYNNFIDLSIVTYMSHLPSLLINYKWYLNNVNHDNSKNKRILYNILLLWIPFRFCMDAYVLYVTFGKDSTVNSTTVHNSVNTLPLLGKIILIGVGNIVYTLFNIGAFIKFYMEYRDNSKIEII